jgi:hypothetical protein
MRSIRSGKAVKVKSSIGRLKFAVIGGLFGGVIAIVGYWILSPTVDSILPFIALRVLVGAGVAMLVGQVIVSRYNKDKT